MSMKTEPIISKDTKILLRDIMDQFAVFLDKAEICRMHRQWLENAAMRVYLRKTQRIIQRRVLTCLDIASIEIEEQYYRRGLFSSFVTKVQEMNPYQVTYLEQALNPVVRS